ncbi:MAG: 2TM domain-containing protein [Chloroflexi bacterium]|nr:2TM domain-containing protein [Chloroflexota bacterium]
MREGVTPRERISDETIRQLAVYIANKKRMRRFRSRRTFFFHLGLYLLSNISLVLFNVYTIYVWEQPGWWSLLSLVFWGLGVIIHYVMSVVLFEEWWNTDDRAIANRYYG